MVRKVLAPHVERAQDPARRIPTGNTEAIHAELRANRESRDFLRELEEQRAAAEASKEAYGRALAGRGYGPVTTEILDAGPFYFAEDYHQQYLAKNPGGYCGIGGTGVSCPVGVPSA